MKYLALAAVAALFPAVIYAQNDDLPEVQTQTQLQINNKACSDLKKTDDKLSEIYKKITVKYSYDKIFLKYLQASQDAWVVYRDAQIKAIYPSEYVASYGSKHNYCACNKMAALTNARIKELSAWLDGIKQGDSCAGTLQLKQPL